LRCTRCIAALRPSPPATDQPPAAPAPPKLIALKEWAPTLAALGAGEQTILLRKGGIKEPRFTPEAARFFLFPTAFHTTEDLLKPGVADRYSAEMRMDPKLMGQIPLAQWAEVTGAWLTEDARVLEALDPLHVWAGGFLEARLKWRKAQPITLLELRTYRLSPPLQLPRSDELFGCFSWVGLPGLDAGSVEAALQGKVPAIDDEAWEGKQRLLRERLGQLADVQPLELDE